MFKKGFQECLYINHSGISRPLVSCSINWSTKTPENKDPEDREPADKGDIQIEYSYD
jgi:hypothetical protein